MADTLPPRSRASAAAAPAKISGRRRHALREDGQTCSDFLSPWRWRPVERGGELRTGRHIQRSLLPRSCLPQAPLLFLRFRNTAAVTASSPRTDNSLPLSFCLDPSYPRHICLARARFNKRHSENKKRLREIERDGPLICCRTGYRIPFLNFLPFHTADCSSKQRHEPAARQPTTVVYLPLLAVFRNFRAEKG